MKIECWSGACRNDASGSPLGVRDSYGVWHPFCANCIMIAEKITKTKLVRQ